MIKLNLKNKKNFSLEARRYTLADCIGIPLRLAPFHLAAILFNIVLGASAPVFSIWATAAFIDAAMDAVSGVRPIGAAAVLISQVWWAGIVIIAIVVRAGSARAGSASFRAAGVPSRDFPVPRKRAGHTYRPLVHH